MSIPAFSNLQPFQTLPTGRKLSGERVHFAAPSSAPAVRKFHVGDHIDSAAGSVGRLMGSASGAGHASSGGLRSAFSRERIRMWKLQEVFSFSLFSKEASTAKPTAASLRKSPAFSNFKDSLRSRSTWRAVDTAESMTFLNTSHHFHR